MRVHVSLSQQERATEAKRQMEQFIRSTIVGANAIFGELVTSGISLDVRIASLEFIEDETISDKTEFGSNQDDHSQILEDLRSWLSNKAYSPTDHTVLLTGPLGSDSYGGPVVGLAETVGRALKVSTYVGQPVAIHMARLEKTPPGDEFDREKSDLSALPAFVGVEKTCVSYRDKICTESSLSAVAARPNGNTAIALVHELSH
ncbi:hypothetical protein BaRGS_00006768, partial [Batillaria attramentaria]